MPTTATGIVYEGRRPSLKRTANQAEHWIGRQPVEFKRLFVEENQETALRWLKAYVDSGTQWALEAWLKAAGVVGETHIQIALVQFMTEKFGTTDHDELLKLINAGREYEQIQADADQGWEAHLDNAIELAKAVLQLHPEARDRVKAELTL